MFQRSYLMPKRTTDYYIYYGLEAFFWESFAFMMLGMALFRWRVFDARRSTSLYVAMVAIGFPLGLAVTAWEQHIAVQNDYISSFDLWSYHVGRTSMAFGYIGLIMLICNRAWLPKPRAILAGCRQKWL